MHPFPFQVNIQASCQNVAYGITGYPHQFFSMCCGEHKWGKFCDHDHTTSRKYMDPTTIVNHQCLWSTIQYLIERGRQLKLSSNYSSTRNRRDFPIKQGGSRGKIWTLWSERNLSTNFWNQPSNTLEFNFMMRVSICHSNLILVMLHSTRSSRIGSSTWCMRI